VPSAPFLVPSLIAVFCPLPSVFYPHAPCPLLHAFYSTDYGQLTLAWIFHELLSRDHKNGRATWQPQGVGSEAYLNGTSQEPTPEDARKDGHIRGRSK